MFTLQSAHSFEIDTAQSADETAATFALLAKGISSFDPQWNEEIDQTMYLDGDGFASSDVTGAQLVIAFEGHRAYGDPAQDFIASLQTETGEGRKTNFRWTEPDGGSFSGKVTVANIVGASGAANEKSTFSFEIHFNGKPTYTAPATGA
ncbi:MULTISPECIES: phage tail tube protein [unclassified Cytobacillus]|jgi:hypothetical protein|uniref:phage tail tube protein n=1 Tax=unclassified Cytobacillus TaxID=2675268 RepID=UPI00203F989B|nr:capsid protein [Cytobacillus sp. AMY 15.2]MCM3090200.1 capsid protein [Cytobacillus sp. AMY 15.2]